MVSEYSAPETSLANGPPEGAWCDFMLRVRSGLIMVHVSPRSADWKMTFPPNHASDFAHGANAIGASQLKRYGTVRRSNGPRKLPGKASYGRMKRLTSVLRSKIVSAPSSRSAQM